MYSRVYALTSLSLLKHKMHLQHIICMHTGLDCRNLVDILQEFNSNLEIIYIITVHRQNVFNWKFSHEIHVNIYIDCVVYYTNRTRRLWLLIIVFHIVDVFCSLLCLQCYFPPLILSTMMNKESKQQRRKIRNNYM